MRTWPLSVRHCCSADSAAKQRMRPITVGLLLLLPPPLPLFLLPGRVLVWLPLLALPSLVPPPLLLLLLLLACCCTAKHALKLPACTCCAVGCWTGRAYEGGGSSLAVCSCACPGGRGGEAQGESCICCVQARRVGRNC